MLSFSLKNTKDVQYTPEIENFIHHNTIYTITPEQQTLMEKEVNNLTDLRFRYNTLLRGGGKIEDIKAAFVAYLDILLPLANGTLSLHCKPPNPSLWTAWTSYLWSYWSSLPSTTTKETRENMISIEFSYDGHLYTVPEPTTSYSFHYELANTVINYANKLTREASRIADTTIDSTISEALALYREAATLFRWLLQNGEVTALGLQYEDLSCANLTFLSKLCLAQVQALVAKRSATKKMSHETIATLAMGTAELYSNAITALKSLKTTPTSLLKTYNHLDLAQAQQLYWSATSYLWQSKGHQAENRHGLEISSLRHSHSFLIQMAQYTTTMEMHPKWYKSYQSLLKLVETRLELAEKENNSIYFVQVPTQAETITPRQLADYVPEITSVYFSVRSNVFDRLQKNPAPTIDNQ